MPALLSRPAFTYPIQPPPRTAVLLPYFRSRGTIRVFGGGWSEEVRDFDPDALAAAFSQLEPLARNKTLSLRHAVIVIKRPSDSWLTESGRERLWEAFRVPVFEQAIGDDGELLATECEAHNGLHVERAAHGFGLPGESIDASPCACGRNTPRLEPAGQVQVIHHTMAAG